MFWDDESSGFNPQNLAAICVTIFLLYALSPMKKDIRTLNKNETNSLLHAHLNEDDIDLINCKDWNRGSGRQFLFKEAVQFLL